MELVAAITGQCHGMRFQKVNVYRQWRLAGETQRTVGLGDHVEPETGGVDLDTVERPVPLPDLDTGLLEDFAPETSEYRLALVDHTTGRAPVRRAVPPPILHQQATVPLDHDPARDAPTLDLLRWWRAARHAQNPRLQRP